MIFSTSLDDMSRKVLDGGSTPAGLLLSILLLAQAIPVQAEDNLPDSQPDCASCPNMIAIAGGSFTMGAPADEPQSSWTERPQHTVDVPGFLLSATPVTFEQWDACVADGGCNHDPDDQGWGRGTRPVINVTWNDAQEYVQWLSTQSGENYRLPSEAEWEFAARAGTTGRYHTGNCIDTDQANFQGGAPAPLCPGGVFREETTPVATFPANNWGLYDMHGNVWEWVQDCWNTSYNGAPDDGSAWDSGDCSRAVLRGGSWSMGGRSIRSATRAYDQRDVRIQYRGFRVARPE